MPGNHTRTVQIQDKIVNVYVPGRALRPGAMQEMAEGAEPDAKPLHEMTPEEARAFARSSGRHGMKVTELKTMVVEGKERV